MADVASFPISYLVLDRGFIDDLLEEPNFGILNKFISTRKAVPLFISDSQGIVTITPIYGGVINRVEFEGGEVNPNGDYTSEIEEATQIIEKLKRNNIPLSVIVFSVNSGGEASKIFLDFPNDFCHEINMPPCTIKTIKFLNNDAKKIDFVYVEYN